MSEQQDQPQTQGTGQDGGAPPAVAQSITDNARAIVDEEQSSGALRGQVVRELASDEIERRRDLLIDAMRDRKTIMADIAKIRPDQRAYNANGNVTNESYSKAKVDELAKTRKRLNKLETAIRKAVENADYSQLGQKGGGDGDGS